MIYQSDYIDENDNTNHYIDSDDFKADNDLIDLELDKIETFNDENILMNYRINVEVDINNPQKENFVLIGEIDDKSITIKQIIFDTKQFVNEITHATLNLIPFDELSTIQEAKDKIKQKLSKELREKQYLLKNVQYDVFGYLQIEKDNVAVFSDINIEKDIIKISDIFSLIDLKNQKDLDATIYIMDNKINVKLDFKECKEGLYIFNYRALTKENITEEYSLLKKKKDFISEEEYIADRKQYISITNNMTDEIDDISDLF